MTEDVAFYVGLAREADGPVVELAVGNGRVAIPVAQAIARPMLGIDSSPAMLEVARERAAEAGVELELREEDMRDFTLAEPAALIYCPFRAMLHLPTWRDKRTVFERVAAALRPGGRFAWNVFVFNPHIAAEMDGKWEEHAGIRNRVTHVPADNRIDLELGTGAKVSLWWATRSEWEGLIEVAGLEVEALYSGFEHEPFDEESREFVWVARKPA
ncbi:MAG: class I SAM-dependent methyltransferase [Actinobacteria bacterium]|nr:MAG: class I SAM-dependent methyltransferase [Actinomycetota bacterium]